MSKFVVLGGAGAMGQIIVRDLAETFDGETVVADYNKSAAEEISSLPCKGKLSGVFVDIKDNKNLRDLLRGATIVINATANPLNIPVMEAALDVGCHYMDLGGLFHYTRKQLELDNKFREKDLLAVLGMGCAPGLTNVMAAVGATELDSVDSIDIAIGCIDFIKVDLPFYLPQSYGLETVLDEYTKESMTFEDGNFIPQKPMSGEREIDFPEPVGPKKAIYTLHSEVATLPLSYKSKGVKRVTFRLGLPDEVHERLKFLVNLGLASSEALELPEGKVVPRKLLAKIVEKFPFPEGDPNNCEVVRVDVAGTLKGSDALVRMETTVYSHAGWKVGAGALDTGVPPSIVAQMIANGIIKDRGVLAPESCVPAEQLFDELAKRTIKVRKEVLSPAGARH
jgi:saccharopine dehydrogenase-like NADP-dependent oxidoreductase